MIARKKPLSRSTKPIPRKPIHREWTCKHCGLSVGGGYKKFTKCPDCGIRRATKRTSLKARCDALARALCRKLADGKCARCGGPGSDWAHRMPRRHHNTRWDMNNCDFLCRKCHRFFTDSPMSFTFWLVERMGGIDALTDLERRANEPWDRDYNRVLASLTEKRKEEA